MGAGALLLGCWLTSCGGSAASPQATLAPPPIDPRLRAIGQGSVVLTVASGGRQGIDPVALARQAGAVPTCADFVFLFSWQVGQPQGIKFVATRTDATFDIAAGKAGQASVGGCVLLEAVNESKGAVSGSLRYFIAEARR